MDKDLQIAVTAGTAWKPSFFRFAEGIRPDGFQDMMRELRKRGLVRLPRRAARRRHSRKMKRGK